MHFLYRENTHKFGIYNNPMNKNGGDVVDDEDELMKYSREGRRFGEWYNRSCPRGRLDEWYLGTIHPIPLFPLPYQEFGWKEREKRKDIVRRGKEKSRMVWMGIAAAIYWKNQVSMWIWGGWWGGMLAVSRKPAYWLWYLGIQVYRFIYFYLYINRATM